MSFTSLIEREWHSWWRLGDDQFRRLHGRKAVNDQSRPLNETESFVIPNPKGAQGEASAAT
jgi:hypothetical protein